MEVREALPADAEAIARVHVRGWQFAYRGLVPDHYLDSLSVDDERTKRNRQLLSQLGPSRKMWVAVELSQVVGFAGAGPTRDEDTSGPTGELYAIYVDPDHWGRGAGSALMGSVHDFLDSEGYREATLWVLEDNERTRRFYERHGWEFDGTTKADERPGFTLHEVRYRRKWTG